MSQQEVFEAMKVSVGFQFIASIGQDRHLFRLPTSAVEEKNDFTALRGRAIEKLDVLQASTKRTDGPLYPLSVFAELDAARAIHVICVDGHQRLRAEKQNGAPTIIVQWISRWETITQAFADAVDLNFARFEVGDDDLVSILQTNKLTVAEVAAHTGKSETAVRDFAKIARHAWACELIQTKAMGRVKLGKLIEACDNNGPKLEALGNALSVKLAHAKDAAMDVRNRMKDRKRNYGPKFKERSHVSFYFRDEDWSAWESALEEDSMPVESRDGKRCLKVEGGGGKAAAPIVGGAEDWEKEIAVYDFFGKRHDDILLEDVETIRERWGEIGGYIDTIIKRKRKELARDENPMPTPMPVEECPASAPPVEQSPAAKVGRRRQK